jgi:hypothetical protein
MAIKYINIFLNLRPSKIYPNWNFWFENKPSGNPDHDRPTLEICNSSENSGSTLRISALKTKPESQNRTMDQLYYFFNIFAEKMAVFLLKLSPFLQMTIFCDFRNVVI